MKEETVIALLKLPRLKIFYFKYFKVYKVR